MNEYGVMMSEHTSMRVGGPATVFCEPADEAGLILCARAFFRAGMPYFFLGNGTNVIVRDGGYPGAVISVLAALGGAEAKPGGRLTSGAGMSLARASRVAAQAGLSGLEALSGIPGSVGGAVYMNAGAYGHNIADILVSAKAYDILDGKIIMLSNAECDFGYRTSIFKTKPLLILSAEFALSSRAPGEIERDMAGYARRRGESQPLELPSAGSFFKRPEDGYAGQLIEAAGLKGARVGGAQISEKHAGFIVNTGGATAGDVLALAADIKAKVKARFQAELEEEPVIIGI
jgi:UDP-N-acetylmuramate dehydrogenase